jgi:hypothetical protein
MSGWVRGAISGIAVLLPACLALGCHSLHLTGVGPEKTGQPLKDPQVAQGPKAPSKYSFRVSQFLFLHDFELKRDQPIFHELANLREQVYKDLQLPSSMNVVQVYLFEDRDHYERFMQTKYPDLPKRRAFFVAQPRTVGNTEDLLVYTYWGDRIQEDLRHELTHALLHSVLKDVPLWLDEGLAENFEVPADAQGVNRTHLDHLRHDATTPFQPDLARLEQLSQVQQMTPAEYREAWAWVHLMLHDKPEAKAVLTTYLQQLRSNANPGALGSRLASVYASPNGALNRHLSQLEAAQPGPRAQTTLRIQ